MCCVLFIDPKTINDIPHALGAHRQRACVLMFLLCISNSVDANAAQSSEQTLFQEARAAYRARAIAAGRARNEKVVADNFFEAGNLEQAAKLYLHALAVAPDAFYYEEKKQIAMRLASANRKSDAIGILEELLTERGHDEKAKLEIAKLLDSLQSRSASITEADAVLKQDSRNRYALLTKADSLRKGKKFTESLPLYRRILQQGNDFDARLGLVYSLLAIGAKVEAKQEFKLIRTRDDAQEEQYYELANVLNAATRPSVDLLLNHYSDSDKNRSAEHGAIIRVVLGNQDWIADVREKDAESPDTTANAKIYSLGTTANVTDRYKVTGRYGRADLKADRRISVDTGQFKVDVKLGAGTLAGNLSWDALNATTASIQSAIQVARKAVELTQPFTDRFKTNLAYSYKNYSDGNAANDFRASADYVFYRGVLQTSLGWGYHRTNYKNPLGAGSYSYSVPENLAAYQAMLTAYYESEKFYVNVDIEYGREAYEKNGAKIKDKFLYNVATLGFKATRKLSLELSNESSDSKIADAEDTYNESIFGARISYLF